MVILYIYIYIYIYIHYTGIWCCNVVTPDQPMRPAHKQCQEPEALWPAQDPRTVPGLQATRCNI